MKLRAAMADGEPRTVSGTLSGENQVAKLIEINSRHFDLRAEGNLLVVAYADRPGVMGTVGALLGQARSTSRPRRSPRIDGRARSWCCGWTGPRPGVLEPIGASIGARTTRLVSFD